MFKVDDHVRVLKGGVEIARGYVLSWDQHRDWWAAELRTQLGLMYVKKGDGCTIEGILPDYTSWHDMQTRGL